MEERKGKRKTVFGVAVKSTFYAECPVYGSQWHKKQLISADRYELFYLPHMEGIY